MTARELLASIGSGNTESALVRVTENGLNYNGSNIFTKLIREAARCSSYSSDVYYDMKKIEEAFNDYRCGSEWEPIFIGFRRHGVDGNSFILSRIEDNHPFTAICKNYFAFYCLDVVPHDDDYVMLYFHEYYT